MRTETDIKKRILDFAGQDDRIRVVLLNGSRANPNIKHDQWQDFDIVFIVEKLDSFVIDHSWTAFLGKKIIFQLPDEMSIGDANAVDKSVSFAYLMLFEDKNRIDLTLFAKQKMQSDFTTDSLTIVWLDKDHLFTTLPPANDQDYHIKRPTEKEFLDTCNEFWWVSTYVVKGLLRNEIIYAKHMLETVVRPMFMNMIKWKVGIENDFSVSLGNSNKLLEKYVSDDFYNQVLLTYSNFEPAENSKSLLLMAQIFQQTSNFVADTLEFRIDKTEEQNTLSYLKDQFGK